jgi:hypothetical protein
MKREAATANRLIMLSEYGDALPHLKRLVDGGNASFEKEYAFAIISTKGSLELAGRLLRKVSEREMKNQFNEGSEATDILKEVDPSILEMTDEEAGKAFAEGYPK